jgi:hypothetical protein
MTINDTQALSHPSLDPASGMRPKGAPHAPFAGRSIAVGLIATVGLASFYVVVLSVLGGPGHLGQQIGQDAVWVVLLTVGFGLQASLMVELRRRHRLARQEGAAVGAAGGASALGMVACCAHHVAELAPLLGATGVAVALTAYRTPLMAVAVVITAIGIGVSIRKFDPHPITRVSHLWRKP